MSSGLKWGVCRWLCFIVLLIATPASAGIPETGDLFVTDVTTASFSVIWASSEASFADIEVFDDPDGLYSASYSDIIPHQVNSGDLSIKEAAENNGVMKVTVTGLSANTTYYFRTLTTSKSTSDITAYPESSLMEVTTESRTVRTYESGGRVLPFGNDIIIEPCYYKDENGTITEAVGSLLIASVPGAGLVTAFVGDGVEPPYALIDLNNMFSKASSENMDLNAGENLTLVNYCGKYGNTIVTHEMPADHNMCEIKNPDAGLSSGANFVSFQLEPELGESATEKVLTSIYEETDSIWAYDASIGEWVFWDKTAPPFLIDLNDLHSRVGLWLVANSPASWYVHGNFNYDPIQLYAGANLVGFKTIESIGIAEAVAPIYSQVESIWTYDASQGGWIFWDKISPPFLIDLDYLEPGRAYWVTCSSDCTW